jgi:hypothetical protein
VFRIVTKTFSFGLAVVLAFVMVVESAWAVQAYDPTRPTYNVKAEVKHLSFDLTMIIVRHNGRFAWINGKKVVVGSVVQGMRVEKIETAFVVLGNGDKRVELRLVAKIVSRNRS